MDIYTRTALHRLIQGIALGLLALPVARAADYTGPIADLVSGSATSLSSEFLKGSPPTLTPGAAPATPVTMTRPFIAVGSAMKAADFGAGPNDYVFLRTVIGQQGNEHMDSLNIQDTRFNVPTDQVKSLSMWDIDGSPLVTMVLGEQPGGQPALRLLNATLTGVAASSVIGRRPVTLVTGTAYVYNYNTNSFIPINDAVLSLTTH